MADLRGKLAGISGLPLKGQCTLHHFRGGLLSCHYKVQDLGDSDNSNHSPARMGGGDAPELGDLSFILSFVFYHVGS